MATLGLLSLAPSKVTAQTIYTIAGTGTSGSSGDGAAATLAEMKSPYGLALDNAGNLYFADNAANVIRKIDVSTRVISTVVGTGTAGSTGDGADASLARLRRPITLAFDATGNMYIVENAGNRVRKVNTSGIISTIAGDGTASSTGDGSAAISATLNAPSGIAIDASGNVYIAEEDGNRIRKINTSGNISTIAGDGTASSTGDGATATAATIDGPTELTFDAAGNLYIAETNGNRIRKITTATGTITTVAGNGLSGSTGDGGLATAARIKKPSGIEFDEEGNLFIVESTGRYIRKVSASTGNIATIAGTGAAGYSGDGGNPDTAQFRRPYGIAYFGGNIFLSDFNASVIRMICDPNAPIVTDTISYCHNATTAPLAAQGTNLLWYSAPIGGVGSSTIPTADASTTGYFDFYVSQTSFEPTCESPRAHIVVAVNAIPAAPTVTSALSYCQASTASVLSATGSSLKWYNAATGGIGSTSAPTPSTTATGTSTYFVTQTTDACESSRSEISVLVNAKPSKPTTTTSYVYCKDATATKLAATGSNILWYTLATGGTSDTTAPTPSTTSSGTVNYYVTQTTDVADGACESDRQLVNIVTNAFPSNPTVAKATIDLCKDGASAALVATGTNLKWYDVATAGTVLATAPTPSTSALSTTDYYVSQSLAASAGGCESGRTQVTVVVNDNPAAPIVVTPINLCFNGKATALDALGADKKWYTSPTGTSTATAPTPSTSTLGTTTYYVTQSSAVGCESAKQALNVTIQPLPLVSVASTATSGNIFCEGLTINIKSTAATATEYKWYDAGTEVAGAITDTYLAGTTGYVVSEVKDIYGCINKDSIFAQQDTSAKPALFPAYISKCTDAEVLLTCNPGFVKYSFNWVKDGVAMVPATLTSNTKSLSEPGNYAVIVTNNFGCIDTTNNAVVSNYPVLPRPIIANSNPRLDIANTYTYYQWYKNGVKLIGANGYTYITSSNGKYHVELTDVNGCNSLSDTVTINNTTNIGIHPAKAALKMYPNPTHNIVYIDAPIKVNVKVTDLIGRLLIDAKNAREVNLENFVAGTYIIIISDEESNLIAIEKMNKVD